ncbi:MAG: pilus assembly PilX N-terminal domain-containing protein [bacterium]
MNFKYQKPEGMIAVLTLFGVTAVTLAIASTLVSLSIGDLKMSRAGGSLEQAFYSAESGLNEALYRLIKNPVPGNYSINLDGTSIAISVSTNPADHYQRIIQSQATDPTGKIRTVRIIANTSSFAGGFDYAVQGGNGGIHMDNNSEVAGGVYSNSSILPAGACPGGESAKPLINGNVWVANSNLLDCVKVGGEVRSNTIHRSIISSNAYYQTIDGSTKVGGTPCPNGHCFPSSPDPLPKPMPINDDDVNTWKTEIINAGNPVLLPNTADCPIDALGNHLPNTYCIMADTTLGLQKIEADIYIDNGVTLTLLGNIWATGKIILQNNGLIKIDPSLGWGSAVIITDDIVDVGENFSISGSGDPRSFVLILSTSTSVDPALPAVYASNNSASIVFAAIHGLLKVKNNGALNAAAAEELWLEPNSRVTYNPLLAAFSVPGGGGGDEVGTALGTWEEK